ncbi:(deoxy)nucleoside triphosphate pyrophosphohydrolase [Persicirhabdus sediminis]|nr:(deoxy)nucleoside triphosphate pyrophosphohydrolase [Persicirhabdus sediminis]
MVEVVCAIIVNEKNQYLACQRASHQSNAGTWEFPGGKIDDGESQQVALEREIAEELDCDMAIFRPLQPVTHSYPHIKIRLWPYYCRQLASQPQALEHAQLKWLEIEQLSGLDWSAADAKIVEEVLQDGGLTPVKTEPLS